jgi:subtilisin-like proprotein convertase family protein
MSKWLLLGILSVGFSSLLAQNTNNLNFWTDAIEREPATALPRYIQPKAYRTVQIELSALQSALPLNDDSEQLITLPMPDGGSARFLIRETPVMAEALQARFPEIRCFGGEGIDDPTARIKCDLTPWGFHAMILSAHSGTVFIDPYAHGMTDVAIAYYKKDFVPKKGDLMSCATVSAEPTDAPEIDWMAPDNAAQTTVAAGDCQFRTYRLALSCTGEYANFHGGTKPLVLAAMNTSMNRVNGVFEKDFALRMVIIPNNDTLIFLNASTDPFSNDNSGALLSQNQTTVTQRIGSANYDIGHVFSTGGGGVANLASVCVSGDKAEGVTGQDSPIGDPFDIDYVAHEMGHQFGGNHCFNNFCGGANNSSTAMEPGSGSTIMAYAGICSPNVQNNSDDYFHAISIQEIAAFITTGAGNNCPVKTPTGNTPPEVADHPNYTIPRSTPFVLTAQATDADNDPMTYCWEQMNNQSATMPPVSTSTVGPMFRSFDPTTSPSRYFPRLQDLVANVNSQWEELPGVARTMNFRVVVRDNHVGAGCTDEDDVVLTVNSAGPFAVTYPNVANLIWNVGESQTVTWNVNNTNMAPVNCANVRIRLSTDGGFTYPTILADNVPNNGSAVITVPNQLSLTCRVMVEAVGNIFFDISNANFRIQSPPLPSFGLNLNSTQTAVCTGTNFILNANLNAIGGFNSNVNISVSGAPEGANVQVNNPIVIPSGTAQITISELSVAMTGNYTLTVTASGGNITQTATYNLTVLPGAPVVGPVLIAPANTATGVDVNTVLTWEAVPFAQSYLVQVATNPSFSGNAIVFNQSANTTSIVTAGLQLAQVYYWRVLASNECGISPYSVFRSFQAGAELCNQSFNSTDVPVNIDLPSPAIVTSNLAINQDATILDVNVSFDITHTWIGDVRVSLVSPGNQTIDLVDQVGVPASEFGCNGENMTLTFDDSATNNSDILDNTCNDTPPAASGTFQPITPLSALNGANVTGNWTLRVTDAYTGEDFGTLDAWNLILCFATNLPDLQVEINEPLTVTSSTSGVIDLNMLSTPGNINQTVYTVLTLPQSGTLLINGVAAVIGSTFTQANIIAGLISYLHGGNTATSDAFLFDVRDQSNNAWEANQAFQIIIVQNTLTATAIISNELLCNGDNTGQITVAVAGGNPPFTYSMNNSPEQEESVYGGLAAGTYFVVVRDALGFTQTAGPIQLIEPTALVMDTDVNLNNLTVNAMGGTGLLVYSIDGINFQANQTFSNLADGVYTVTVRDANSCTAQVDAIVTLSTLLAAAQVVAAPLCFGDTAGSIAVSVGGGVGPYEYSLDGVNFQQNNTFDNLAANTYVFTVKDGNGTLTTTAPVTIISPAPLALSISTDNHVITATATGGTGNYLYSINGTVPDANNVFSVLSSGNYTIVATDQNNCSLSGTVMVTIPVFELISAVTTNVNVCTGVIGAIEVTVNGGIPPYEYRLDGGAWVSSNQFLNVGPGNHVVEARDAAQTIVQTTVTGSQPTNIAINSIVSGNDATVIATGGTGGLTYQLGNQAPQNNGVYDDLSNGIYTVTVTDQNGCTNTASFVIQYAPPVINTVVTNVSCAGVNDGSIVVTVINGLPPYSINPSSLINLAPGVYTVSITDAAGTIVTATATVGSPSPLAINLILGNGSLVVQTTGGTTPYQYSIDNGVNYQLSNTFNGISAGTYTVIVRDGNDCTATASTLVNSAQNLATAWAVELAPNPTGGDYTTLHIAQGYTGELLYNLTDATGRTLQTARFEVQAGDFTTRLSVSHLPNGIYFVHLRHQRGYAVLPIVVSH